MGNCQTGQQQKDKSKNQLKIKGPNSAQKKVNECKIVLLGDQFVGKSCMVNQFCHSIFDNTYNATIGGAYTQSSISLKNGNVLKLNVWDTAGEERFRSMATYFYRESQGAILVYDVTQTSSYDSVNYWLEELDNQVRNEGLVIGLAGNKCDRKEEKVVQPDKVRSFAKEKNLIFYETSAKTGEGINELFQKIGEEIAKNMEKDNFKKGGNH